MLNACVRVEHGATAVPGHGVRFSGSAKAGRLEAPVKLSLTCPMAGDKAEAVLIELGTGGI